MPLPSHDIFALGLQTAISKKLEYLESHEHLKDVISLIAAISTSNLTFGKEVKGIKSPDAAFCYRGASYPSLVIEVANSQKRRDLVKITEGYVKRTNGSVKTVITMDLEYLTPAQRRTAQPNTKRTAAYSVYRNRITYDIELGKYIREAKRDISNQTFRPVDGSPVIGSLCLKLSDLCPDGVLTGMEDPMIEISHEELAAILTKAETYEKYLETPPSPSSSAEETPFRPQTRSPTPDLNLEDEARWTKAENVAMELVSENDSSFSSAEVEATP